MASENRETLFKFVSLFMLKGRVFLCETRAEKVPSFGDWTLLVVVYYR